MRGAAVLTVSQLNRYVKSLLEEQTKLRELYVRGEVSNFVRHQSSGHLYFSLKEESASVRCVMFRSYAEKLPFLPANGMAVLLRGSGALYERDGSFQLYAYEIIPDGAGSMAVAVEQLKRRLSALGYFDPEHKKALPPFPEQIGVITSPTGAVIQDILQVIQRRYPLAEVRLYPALMQGEGCAASVAGQLQYIQREGRCDLVIIARGGGSAEDLWQFNREEIAQAVFRCTVPVISAVGHETDVTICDLVADLRAPTPSAAAELAVPDRAQLLASLYSAGCGLRDLMQGRLDTYESGLKRAPAVLEASYERIRRHCRERLEYSASFLQAAAEHKLALCRRELERQASRLNDLNPVQVLLRGYSITCTPAGEPIARAAAAAPGDEIVTRLADGQLISTVTARRSFDEKERDF